MEKNDLTLKQIILNNQSLKITLDNISCQNFVQLIRRNQLTTDPKMRYFTTDQAMQHGVKSSPGCKMLSQPRQQGHAWKNLVGCLDINL